MIVAIYVSVCRYTLISETRITFVVFFFFFVFLFFVLCFFFLFFFFFKQKTAYEIYQCDWSSDVCSSDLRRSVIRGLPSGSLREQM